MKDIKQHEDWKFVDSYGPAELAKKLGYSIQRVHNWKYRGIPPREKIKHREILMQNY